VLLLATGLLMCLLGGMNIHIAVTLLTVKDALPPAAAGLPPSPAAAPGLFYTDVIPLVLVLVSATFSDTLKWLNNEQFDRSHCENHN